MITYSAKLRYSIAVKQLKKGYLTNNLGKIEFSRRLYTQPVFDNEGKLYEITKATNFGYKKEGKLVTTKGISQLDYFREVGVRNTIAKASKELLGFFEFSDIISYVMDEKPETIMTGFAPADFVVAVLAPEILNSIKETWDNVVYELAEKAKDKGIAGINDFLQTSGGQELRYGFGITQITQEILNKLLTGKIKTIDELKDLKDNQMIKNNYNQSIFIYSVFYYKKQQENKDEDTITFIDSIFTNN
ncbi:hypothetical protein [Flavobacterium aquidurense]|uniref:hypothetical protein n=1 Tax=Flavobacterium aquidurense TaxID=362413 RepID=UPI002859F51B|nr:hypothetical protein [Flavobacterium aquidurense]MDR7371009.1 hypothetical protein [Flavobacterium aquidurense]